MCSSAVSLLFSILGHITVHNTRKDGKKTALPYLSTMILVDYVSITAFDTARWLAVGSDLGVNVQKCIRGVVSGSWGNDLTYYPVQICTFLGSIKPECA